MAGPGWRVPSGWATSLVLLIASASPAIAQWMAPEFQVNSFWHDLQYAPAVAAGDRGEFVVVWTSIGQDAWGTGVFGQRFDAGGQPAGGEFQVNEYTPGYQSAPAVARADSGGFLVAWTSHDVYLTHSGIYGRRFDAQGVPVGDEFRIDPATSGDTWGPAVAADGSGRFVVVWVANGQDGSGRGVFGQRLDAEALPLGDGFQVNTFTTGDQLNPAVAADALGAFVAVWQGAADQDGSGTGVFGQRYDPAGLPLQGEFQVNHWNAGFQGYPAVVAHDAGDFVVVWQSDAQDGVGMGVYGQRYDPAGVPLESEEFRVNTYTLGSQEHAALAADGRGGFAVVWQSRPGQDGSGSGVFGQLFDAGGARSGGELQINSYTPGSQWTGALAAADNGDVVVAWTSDDQDGSLWGVFGRRVLPAIFADGFETNDCAWTFAVGGGGGCPP